MRTSLSISTSTSSHTRTIERMRTHGIADITHAPNHMGGIDSDGVDPNTFETNERLSSFFDVLSTNVDRNGRPFVSTIEGKSAPVYGAQWHPERPQFEWRDDASHRSIPHTEHALISMHAFAYVPSVHLSSAYLTCTQLAHAVCSRTLPAGSST